jgi:glycosyltransferase involved in cell wall biosynthesis
MATHVVPYPPGAGNELRIFGLLRFLAENGFSTCLLIRPLEPEPVTPEILEKLKDMTAEVHVFGHVAQNESQCSAGSTVLPDSDFTDAPLSAMQDMFCPAAFLSCAQKLMSRFVPDVVIAEYIFMSRVLLLSSAKNTLKIIDTHDIFHHKTDDARRCGIETVYPTREQEVRLLERCDVIMAIQQREKNIFQTLLPEKKVVLSGVDFSCLPPEGEGEPGRVLIVASGNDFNVFGAQHFIDCIWPKVASTCPHAHLHIVGKVCAGLKVQDKRISLLNFVEDLDVEYREAKVVVNPTPVGTGLKIKSVEALAWAKPHVAWPVAADGLNELALCVPISIAHNVSEFADALIRFLQDDALCATMADKAYHFMRKYFSPNVVYKELADILELL